MFVYSLLWVKRDLWVDSPACMFIPVSILVWDVGRKREKECVPCPLHGSFRDVFLEHSTLVTLQAARSKNVPVLYTTASVDMFANNGCKKSLVFPDILHHSTKMDTVRPEGAPKL